MSEESAILCGQEGVQGNDDLAVAGFTWSPDTVHRVHILIVGAL